MFQSTNDFVDGIEDYSNAYYVGVVTNNNDPLGLGRVQATVPGLYDPSQGAVPWIAPLKDSPFGFGTGQKGQYGVYGSPPEGSIIKIELQNGDPHKPLFTSLYTLPNANAVFSSPNVWGYQDPSGNQLVVNMATGTWTWTHSSGDQIAYDASGDRVTAIQGNDNLNVGKKLTIIVQGNAWVQSDTRVDIQAPLTTLNSVTPM
jgi:hypothetical protein